VTRHLLAGVDSRLLPTLPPGSKVNPVTGRAVVPVEGLTVAQIRLLRRAGVPPHRVVEIAERRLHRWPYGGQNL
jgi:hypothetical protein